MSNTKHIGHQVVAMMDRLGVSPLSRNYHLFYMCIANSNPDLRRALRNLGMRPTQHELDQVIEAHCAEAVDSYVVRRHEGAVLSAIDDLASRIRSEQSDMSSFQSAMDRVSAALVKSAEKDKITTDLLLRVVGAIEQAGSRRAASSSRTLQRMDKSKTEVEALRTELVKMRKMANTDSLTGLANRRNFDERLAAAVGKPTNFALFLADIDHFKRINDVHGHAFGDHVLKVVAATMTRSLRAGTFVARTGGEEFAVVLTRAEPDEVMTVAERVRRAIERVVIHKDGEEVRLTVSLGVVMPRSADTADEIYAAADAALYLSKGAGRNRVTMHDPSADESSSARYKIYSR